MDVPIVLAPATLAELGSWAIKVLRKSSGLELSYDTDSVLKLDQWINDHHHEVSSLGRDLLGTVFGAYLGECMRRELGGAWVNGAKEWGIHIVGSGRHRRLREAVFYPLRKARRQMLEGDAESVAVMYLLAGGLGETAQRPGDPRLEFAREFLRRAGRGTAVSKTAPCPDGTIPVCLRLVADASQGDVSEQPPDLVIWLEPPPADWSARKLWRVRDAFTRALRLQRQGGAGGAAETGIGGMEDGGGGEQEGGNHVHRTRWE